MLNVAFLRAINVANTWLSNDNLRALFADSGALSAETFIASGNVIFECETNAVSDVAAGATRLLKARHSIDQPIFLQSLSELQDLAAIEPFAPDTAPNFLHYSVSFAEFEIDESTMPSLPIFAPKADIKIHSVHGRCVLSNRYRITGNATDVSSFVEKTLGVRCTTRNWNTVTRILKKYG